MTGCRQEHQGPASTKASRTETLTFVTPSLHPLQVPRETKHPPAPLGTLTRSYKIKTYCPMGNWVMSNMQRASRSGHCLVV